MRTGAGFQSAAAAAPTELHQHEQAAHLAWHSPVPYLFGGLAAMLGLIAFALLVLACSYWKLSGYLEGNSDAEAGSNEADGKATQLAEKPPISCFEERIVVIMAGDEKPTFLATPISSRASFFGDNNTDSNDTSSNEAHDAKKPESQFQTQNPSQDQTQSQEPVQGQSQD